MPMRDVHVEGVGREQQSALSILDQFLEKHRSASTSAKPLRFCGGAVPRKGSSLNPSDWGRLLRSNNHSNERLQLISSQSWLSKRTA